MKTLIFRSFAAMLVTALFAGCSPGTGGGPGDGGGSSAYACYGTLDFYDVTFDPDTDRAPNEALPSVGFSAANPDGSYVPRIDVRGCDYVGTLVSPPATPDEGALLPVAWAPDVSDPGCADFTGLPDDASGSITTRGAGAEIVTERLWIGGSYTWDGASHDFQAIVRALRCSPVPSL